MNNPDWSFVAREQFLSALELMKQCKEDSAEFEYAFSIICSYKNYFQQKSYEPMIVKKGTQLI